MVIGISLLAIGLLLLAVGQVMTRRAIEAQFGKLDQQSIARSKGTGVVPLGVSLMVLLGWAFVVVGGIVALLSLL
jgi:hypothetical protein